MNKKSKSVLKKSGAILIILIFAVYTWTVYCYGNFDIYGTPHRVIIHGFRYDNTNNLKVLTCNDKPMYEVSGIIDKLTGKRIYSSQNNFKASLESRVYLHIKADKYNVLQCGGGM